MRSAGRPLPTTLKEGAGGREAIAVALATLHDAARATATAVALLPPPQSMALVAQRVQQGPSFVDACVTQRPNPACLPSSTTAAAGQASGSGAQAPRVGLNPYLLERNRFLQSAKQNKGATLSAAEVAQASEDFREMWKNMGGSEAFKHAYDEWRRTLAPQASEALATYRQIWGGGCSATPITKEEMFEFHKTASWPSDAEAPVGAWGEASMCKVLVELRHTIGGVVKLGDRRLQSRLARA